MGAADAQKGDFYVVSVRAFFVNFFRANTVTFHPKNPKCAIYNPKRDDEHPCHCYIGVSSPHPGGAESFT